MRIYDPGPITGGGGEGQAETGRGPLQGTVTLLNMLGATHGGGMIICILGGPRESGEQAQSCLFP